MIKNSARMRLLYWTFLGLSFIAPVSSSAQMQTSNGIQYGNEWIEYDRDYLKISVGQDGLYRIDGKTLQESGLPANVRGDQLKLIWLGNEQPISLTSDDIFSETDYLEFYGQRNTSQVDRHLWSDPDQQMLNPSYSLYSDTSAYYLTWSSENRNLRYQEGGALMDNSEPRTTYRHQQEVFLRNRLNKPTLNSQGVRFSTYQSGEGYGSTLTTRHSVKIPADHIAEGERPAVLRYRLSGNSQSHVVDVEWNTTPLGNLTFFGSALIDSSYTIASSDLAEANTIKFTSSGGSDRIVVSSFDLTYDRELVYSTETLVYPFLGAAAGFRFSLKTEPGEQGKIVAYDVSDRHKLLVEPSVDGVMVHVPPGSDVRDILITDISNALTPGLIKRMAFEDLTTTQGDYIIISSSKLAGSELDAYAQYRSSPAGGGYDATLATIEQLTDQFAYGVPMHPLGIKNFVNYVAAAWTEPKFVFIIGRGYHYNIVRTASRTNHLVPSFGIPGSDNVMASAGNSSIPQVPIGRLAASSVQDITNYLDKVVVMEDQMANAPQTVQDRAWMKRILHLSAGGVGGSERLILENSLKSMGQILERNKFGADITSFSKNSQDLVTEEINEDLTRLVEDGIILKTYFGHGGINITELDNFEQPENFNNLNRYSCMVSLGCHTGDMYTDVVSLSEDNVLAVDRGAIAYIATSGLGFLSSLDQFGDTWYDLLGGEFYGAALGASLKGAIERMSSSSSIGITTLLQQLTLHGDPAYRLSPEGQGSDFTFDIATARTEPSTVSSTAKSFDFIVDLVNLGQSVEDSVSIRFQRVLADGSIGEEKEIVTQVNGFSSTLQVTFDNSIPGISGKNTIRAVVNNDRLIPEAPDPQAYNNNALSSQTEGFAFFIRDNSILPTSPCEFSILNDPGDLVLRASTSDPFAKSNTYHFELDTTRRFNSPLQMRETITSKGGVIEWSPTFALTEGQVYYWRVSPDSTSEQPYLWEESSFTYRPQSNTGWSQSHHGQFELDDLIGLVPKSNGRMQFDSTGFFMTITNGVWSSEVGAQFNFETNAVSIRPWLVTNEGVAIVVIDPTTGILWENVSGQFGSISTGSINSKRAFVFPTSTTEERDLVIDML
ncbi:MAG: hypothetical protein KTR24_06800, partial [Saprospiraceae bacterium]|nr:hypothetical protein [Saprospiraceae bacterium]